MKQRNTYSVIIIHAAVLLGILVWANSRQPVRGAEQQAAAPQASPSPSPATRARFSLSTMRAYGAQEQPRVYINYQGVETLDFRVYRIKDPFQFFRQLENPHRMGEEDYSEVSAVSAAMTRRPSALEKLRDFKRTLYYSVKSYIRGQLTRKSRTAFNDKFLAGEQRPLLEADFARVPLLNPDQLVRSWKQILSPLDNEYDTRMVAIGKREAGVYLVEAVHGDLRAYTIAVVTDLTIINKTTNDGQMLIYTVDRQSGEPRGNVEIQVMRAGKMLAQGATNKDGVMQTRIAEEKPAPKPVVPREDIDPEEEQENAEPRDYLIMAGRGSEFAVSDLSSYYFRWGNDFGGGENIAEDITSYVYTDRPIYRPGQKVYFKGILRRLGDAGYEMLPSRTITVVVTDPNDAEVLKKEVQLSARGSFSGEVEIAANAPLGGYQVTPKIGEATAGGGYFQVAEYKKPEYKVTVATPRKFVAVGEKANFAVEAKYFFGEPVRQAEVKYYIYRSRYYHWWRSEEEDDGLGESGEADDGEGDLYGYGNDMVKEGEGRLDANGKLDIAFEVPPPNENEPWDYTYRLEAQVTDSSRRQIDGQASFVGTRGKVVVFAQPERYVYYQNDSATIKVRAGDYEGRPQAARVTLRFIEIKYEKVQKEENGYSYIEYKPIKTELSTAEVTTNAQGEAVYQYRVPIVGYIRIETVVREGNRSIPSIGGYLYSTDRNNSWADMASREYGSIKLIPDKTSYRPGETARVLAILPNDKAHLLVTTEMNRIIDARHVYTEGRVAMLEVPITDSHVPNVYLSVTYIKSGRMYENNKSLVVPARDKFLQLELIPDKKQYKPRDPASYTVLAKYADGSPAVGVEVSLGVVDEAIYSISPDRSGDIRRAFYGTRYSSVSTNFSSEFSFIGYSGKKTMQLAQNKRSYQLADFKNESQYAEATIRKDFKDTAFWQPEVVTGADGKATARLTLPDNLTTWRATARAVSADLRVGSRVDRVLSRKDLILRLETPRFMTEGDVVTVSGIVHNYLNADKVTQIELKVTGATLLDEPRQTVTIAKQGEQRIDWRINAREIGNVTLLATAKTDAESDGIELPLPVLPMGLKQTKAEAAALTAENVEKIYSLNLPANANTQARALRIEASPSIAGSLFGALDYLTSYPYGCVEQTMSSFLPNVVVAQTLKEVRNATLREDNNLPRKVQRGLERLYELQHSDGGWGWWKNDKTDPFMTAYVVDGLAQARQAGFGLQAYRIDQAREKIQSLLDAGKLEDGKPIDPESRAYLVYAFHASGEGDAKYVNDLFGRRQELQPYGRALLALTLKGLGDQSRAKQVATEIERSAKVTDYDAHWESIRRPMLDFTETVDLEATAFSLKALARILPESALLPKAARWLVANRRNGYFWESTKHTAMAILGLTDYLRVSRELTADYTVEVYLNGELVMTKRVTAAEAAGGQALLVERKGAALGVGNQIRVIKRGAGTLYFSAALEYFTREETVAPRGDANLSLTREYLRLKVTEENGQPKWALEPLTGELKSGDLIVARLKLQGARARYLLLEDPIPAGCEQIEQVSGINLSVVDGRWSDWYSQREFRDQRTVFFVDYFSGATTFQYAMRVQVPGDFKVAPARAELMYQPAVQTNTSNAAFRIADKQ